MSSKDLFIGYDEELGGQVIRCRDGSYILFKNGDIVLCAQGQIFFTDKFSKERAKQIENLSMPMFSQST